MVSTRASARLTEEQKKMRHDTLVAAKCRRIHDARRWRSRTAYYKRWDAKIRATDPWLFYREHGVSPGDAIFQKPVRSDA